MTFPWENAQPPQAGQFLTIRVSERAIPLLRRPFAFSHFAPSEKTASIIIKRRGTATDILWGRREGEYLDIIGPLGNSFHEPEPGKAAVVMAGGIGLGPMLFLADDFRRKKISTLFIFGCRTTEQLPGFLGLEKTGSVICTDDGSAGFQGTPVDYLKILAEPTFSSPSLYACGPLPMLKSAALLAQSRSMVCWVSMEQTLGCSMGACMGCVIRVTHEPGYARVCREGPVFDSREVQWT